MMDLDTWKEAGEQLIRLEKRLKSKQRWQAKKQAKRERLAKANQLISLISSTGRNFLSHTSGEPTKLEIYKSGHIRLQDPYTRKWIYPYKYITNQRWSEGGTMWSLVCMLTEWIKTGKPRVTNVIWGYQYWEYPVEDMERINEMAREIGYLRKMGETE